MKDEVKKVLEMVRDGRITPEDAYKLIEAIQSKNASQEAERNPKEKRFIRINVMKEGRQAVNLTVPFSFLDVMLKIGGKGRKTITVEGEEIPIDIDVIREALKDPNFYGKIVDVDVPEENTKVLIEIV